MGYKLAGCTVLGNIELDPKMNKMYVENHKPKFNYQMDIREFNNIPNSELPTELFNLDILDGSPPCTTFSMAGQREKTWGKLKKFREGQKEQTLDDLSFVFIDTVAKLKPKTVIIENVEGLLKGNAFEYVQKIYAKLSKIGYSVKHWLIKCENMGIPQRRHRCVFVAIRNDINFCLDDLDLFWQYEPITYREIKTGNLGPMDKNSEYYRIAIKATSKDKSIADTKTRLGGKRSGFQTNYVRYNDIIPTLKGRNDIIDIAELSWISKETIINAQTFPQDYMFIPNGKTTVDYVCGMSVPPLAIKRIVDKLIEQGLFDYKQQKRSNFNE